MITVYYSLQEDVEKTKLFQLIRNKKNHSECTNFIKN